MNPVLVALLLVPMAAAGCISNGGGDDAPNPGPGTSADPNEEETQDPRDADLGQGAGRVAGTWYNQRFTLRVTGLDGKAFPAGLNCVLPNAETKVDILVGSATLTWATAVGPDVELSWFAREGGWDGRSVVGASPLMIDLTGLVLDPAAGLPMIIAAAGEGGIAVRQEAIAVVSTFIADDAALQLSVGSCNAT